MYHDIITIGSATRDVFLQIKALHTHPSKDAITHIEAALPFGSKINVEQIHYDTGGGATNSAATFAHLGKFRVGALTRVGQDSAGRDILAALKYNRVDTALIQHAAKEATGYSTILYHGGSAAERTILVHRGASQKLEQNKIPWNKLQAKWFYITSLGGDFVLLKTLLTHAKRIGAKIIWNPGAQEIAQLAPNIVIASVAGSHAEGRSASGGQSRRSPRSLRSLAMTNPLFSQLTFLLLNREEAAELTGISIDNTTELLRALTNFAPVTLMTDGSKGAYAVIDKKAYSIPSGGAKPKNLTGAGDAFGSGFLTVWIKNNGNIEEALRVGTLNSNSVVQHIGAKIGILKKYPTKNQLNKLTIKEIKL